jgi:hypothetical protein
LEEHRRPKPPSRRYAADDVLKQWLAAPDRRPDSVQWVDEDILVERDLAT